MSKSTKTHQKPQVESNSSEQVQSSEPQEASKHSVEVEQQMVFNSAGDLEPDSESVETSLEAFGADVDHRKRPTQVAEPAASEFGVDDRTEVTEVSDSDQSSLFTDVKNDQQTLEGEDASNQCLFDDESGPEETQ